MALLWGSCKWIYKERRKEKHAHIAICCVPNSQAFGEFVSLEIAARGNY